MSTNVALGKTAMASSFVVPYGPSRAVDGNLSPSNRWLCNQVPGWLKVNLGAQYSINRWVITLMGNVTAWGSNYNMQNITFQTSLDGNTWTTVDSVTGNTLGKIDRTFTPTLASFVRVVSYVITINKNIASVLELEVYDSPITPMSLLNLSVSSGTLKPVFSPTIFNYTDAVDNGVSSITVTPTINPALSSVKVNGVVVTSGTPSVPINLNVGNNAINVVVTSLADGKQQTYTLNVIRTSTYLSGLVLTNGTLTPAFTPNTYTYNVGEAYETQTINVAPTAQDTTAQITVNVNNGANVAVQSGQSVPAALNVGLNTINVTVTAATSAKQTYAISANRLEAGPYLTGITLTYTGGVGDTLPFDPYVTSYGVKVASSVSAIIVKPTAASGCTMTVNGLNLLSGCRTISFPLANPTITLTIKVTSGGVSRNYIIAVSRNS
jgi:hypothetical protein